MEALTQRRIWNSDWRSKSFAARRRALGYSSAPLETEQTAVVALAVLQSFRLSVLSLLPCLDCSEVLAWVEAFPKKAGQLGCCSNETVDVK